MMLAKKPNYDSKEFMSIDEYRAACGGMSRTTHYEQINRGVSPIPVKFGRFKRAINRGERDIQADIKLAAREGSREFGIKANEIIAEVKEQLGVVPAWVLELVAVTKEEIDNPVKPPRRYKKDTNGMAVPAACK